MTLDAERDVLDFRAIAEALPAMVAVSSDAGDLVYVNELWQTYTGLSREEIAANRARIIHPGDFQRVERATAEAIARGEAFEVEYRVRRHDGAYRWHSWRAVPLRDSTGEVVRWIGTTTDIDAQRQAEARERFLAESTRRMLSPLDSEELLAELARLAVPAVADICAVGLFDDSPETPRAETAGVTEDERPYVQRIHLRRWLVAAGSKRTIDEAIRAAEPVFVPDFDDAWIAACAPDADQRAAAMGVGACSLICVPLAARGKTLGMSTFAMVARSNRRYTRDDLALIQEVTSRASIVVDNLRLYDDLKETAEHLRHANAAKDEFLGLVSHELKTPITTIAGNADVLLTRTARIDDASRTAALRDISAESNRLDRIIDNLLALARLERGQELELEPVLVPRIVARLLREQAERDPERTVTAAIDDDAPPVHAHPVYVEQILRNLLSNAEKYSEEGQPIELAVQNAAGGVSVTVRDRGPGFADAESEQLFTPFYRSPRTAAYATGIGIGLAVCKRLIEAMGGEMWARARDGGGSEFGFRLPAMPREDQIAFVERDDVVPAASDV